MKCFCCNNTTKLPIHITKDITTMNFCSNICLNKWLKDNPVPCNTCNKDKCALGTHIRTVDGTILIFCNSKCSLRYLAKHQTVTD